MIYTLIYMYMSNIIGFNQLAMHAKSSLYTLLACNTMHDRPALLNKNERPVCNRCKETVAILSFASVKNLHCMQMAKMHVQSTLQTLHSYNAGMIGLQWVQKATQKLYCVRSSLYTWHA